MNKFKTALLILFAVVIVILIFFLVKNENTSTNTSGSDKMLSEIKYMDNKLTTLLNSLNNISLENYKVSITKTSTSSNATSNSTSGSQEGGAAEQESGESSESGNSQSSSNSNSANTSSSDTSFEQYRLKEEGILTGNSEIDWEAIKNEIEILYSITPTITLDLYNMNANQDDILSFNKELDELTSVVKEENKEQTLIKLANLYRYLPVYANSSTNDLEYVNLLQTKSNVFNSYVFANNGNWGEATNYIKKSIDSYSAILNNIDSKKTTYDTNKIYVILNELQNAADMQDLEIFLIKYKTFLEETEKNN